MPDTLKKSRPVSYTHLNNILSPFGLAKRLAGLGIYEKRIALQYPLPATYIIAAVVRAAVLFLSLIHISVVLAVIALLGVYYYVALPAVNIHATEF